MDQRKVTDLAIVTTVKDKGLHIQFVKKNTT
jgi:hypothetical protein